MSITVPKTCSALRIRRVATRIWWTASGSVAPHDGIEPDDRRRLLGRGTPATTSPTLRLLLQVAPLRRQAFGRPTAQRAGHLRGRARPLHTGGRRARAPSGPAAPGSASGTELDLDLAPRLRARAARRPAARSRGRRRPRAPVTPDVVRPPPAAARGRDRRDRLQRRARGSPTGSAPAAPRAVSRAPGRACGRPRARISSRVFGPTGSLRCQPASSPPVRWRSVTPPAAAASPRCRSTRRAARRPAGPAASRTRPAAATRAPARPQTRRTCVRPRGTSSSSPHPSRIWRADATAGKLHA